MAELSSNWKALKAKLDAASGGTANSSKRKRVEAPPSGGRKKFKTSQKPMGAVQSTNKQADAPKETISPSLALWAEDNDISTEKIAEAYGLGLKDHKAELASYSDKINSGLIEGLEVGKYIAMDCEMVGVGDGGYASVLGRISIVDYYGKQVYDSYVKPKERVTDWRTEFSGLSPKEMKFARTFEEVQTDVAALMTDRILIGHDLKHDLDVLKLGHPARDIRDTAKHRTFKKYGNSRKPSLRNLARGILGVEIQSGAHSSIEDARVAMLLFRKHKSEFDMEYASLYNTHRPGRPKAKAKGKRK